MHHRAATRDAQCRNEVRGPTGACAGSGAGRFRAAAARGVENEPTHAQRSVRGRRKAAVQGGGAGRRRGVLQGGGHRERARARSTERARVVQGGGVGRRRPAAALKTSLHAVLQGGRGTGRRTRVHARSWERVRGVTGRRRQRARKTFSLGQVRISDVLTDVLRSVREHHVKMEGDFVNTVISTLLLEGIGRRLDPGLDLFKSALPILRQLGGQMAASATIQSERQTGHFGAMLKVWVWLEARQLISASIDSVDESVKYGW
ncbi:hypothetical protein GGX14DRAFT_638070 [Mycena pura]|uniref:Uncharacterized protein n=1 Tax=Mycena pura TaxID=153505 RepID=A0AAD6YNU1_9AGAR|nr:hypothetical protein GGX14DRAFT_638070 [Mycena pura]